MKKLSIALAIVLVLAMSLLVLSACDAKITKIEVKQGTIDNTITVGDTLSVDKAVILATYSDGTVKQVTKSDGVVYGTVDTSKAGDVQLSITYDGITIKYTITVEEVAPQGAVVTSLTSQLLTEYNTNKSIESDNREGFFDTTSPLYVGDDNIFHLRAVAQGQDATDGTVKEYSMKDITKTITVEMNIDGQWITLTEDIADYVVVDVDNATFDFGQDAIGQQYKITITATNIAEGVSASDCAFTAEITVIDGYNVYDAIDLSVYDNTNTNYGAMAGNGNVNMVDAWANKKAGTKAEGVTADKLILQSNINITAEDLPAEYFWKKTEAGYDDINAKLDFSQRDGDDWVATDRELEGSLKDLAYGSGVYVRTLGSGEQFEFLGNYFTINAEQISTLAVECDGTGFVNNINNDILGPHMGLFYNGRDEYQYNADTRASIRDTYYVGNATNSGLAEDSGGLALVYGDAINFDIDNVISKNFAKSFFYIGHGYGDIGDEQYFGNLTINNTKSYDMYEGHLYVYGGVRHALITDSEWIGCGAPAILTDEVQYTDGKYRAAHINVVNSDISTGGHNGLESWYDGYNMTTLIGGLKALNMVFTDLPMASNQLIQVPAITGYMASAGLTVPNVFPSPMPNTGFLDGEEFDVLIVNKKNGTDFAVCDMHGYSRIFEDMQQYNTYYGLEGQTADTSVIAGLDNEGTPAGIAVGYSTYCVQGSGGGGDFLTINPMPDASKMDPTKSTFDVQHTGAVLDMLAKGGEYYMGEYMNLYLPQGGFVVKFK